MTKRRRPLLVGSGGGDRGRKETKRFQYQFLASMEEGLGVSEDRNVELQKWMKRAQ